jgi:hypothetical protein
VPIPQDMRLHALALLWPLAHAVPAAATASAVTTEWTCALSADAVRLVCAADGSIQPEPATPEAMDRADPREQPPPALATAAAAAPVTPTAIVNGVAFPLDRGRRWTVDLWSPPTEPDNVALLARATICYRSPGCSVRVLPWAGASSRR